MPEGERKGEKVFKGIPVSGGVCQGRVVVLGRSVDSLPRFEVAEADLNCEMHRLNTALVETRRQIQEVQRKVSESIGGDDASIFDAHLLLLEDQTILDEVTRSLRARKVNVEQVFNDVIQRYLSALASIKDPYLSERSADLEDIATRVLANLLGRQHNTLLSITEPSIVVAHDLTPSTTAQMDKKMVMGFVTEVGSKTSHTAIMARALQIPAMVGLAEAAKNIHTGDYVLLDGYTGILILNPTDQSLFEYGKLIKRQEALQEKLRDVVAKPSVTLDGRAITLSANIGQPEDRDAVIASGAEGVGLFRSEFLFLNRDSPPSEEEQFEAYRVVASALNPHPVVIRTLDLGGDKFVSENHAPTELNPFLGWRAIRYCLQEKEVFRTQLRAILRASAHGNIKMMYPMISGIGELDEADGMLAECKKDLSRQGIAFNDAMEVGVMIEIPSAAMTADALARRCKFFSIGSNDLIQYTIAVDRLNEKVAHLSEPTHPAILQLIKMTSDAGRRHGIWTGVCGEAAGDLGMVPLLIGLGVEELSVAPPYVSQVKFLIRRMKYEEAKALANWALEQESGTVIRARAQEFVQTCAPSLLEI